MAAGGDKDDMSNRQFPVTQNNSRSSQPLTSCTVEPHTTAESIANARNMVAGLPMADSSYDELKCIGNGAYGTVYLGRDRTNEGRLVALKKIRITLNDDGVPVNALREIAVLKKLETFEHPNIVRLLDICHGCLERGSRLTLILVFEYVEQDLDSYLKKCPSPGLDGMRIKSLVHQILCGVDFLHTNRIIHRDLKPQNLLVDRYDRVKIADFGLAKIYDFNMRLTSVVVTLWYRAPEVLLSNSYATPVDVWSCGCIFAELFRRKALFEGQNEGDQLQRIFDVIGKPLESEWPPDVSLSLANFRDLNSSSFEDVIPEISLLGQDLLKKLLTFVPGKRFSADEALHHPYFDGLTMPNISSSSHSCTPTNQLLGPSLHQGVMDIINRQTQTFMSPLRHIASMSNTVANTTISTPVRPAFPPINVFTEGMTVSSIGGGNSSVSAFTTVQSAGTNDENNPNAGNSSTKFSLPNTNVVIVTESKLSEISAPSTTSVEEKFISTVTSVNIIPATTAKSGSNSMC